MDGAKRMLLIYRETFFGLVSAINNNAGKILIKPLSKNHNILFHKLINKILLLEIESDVRATTSQRSTGWNANREIQTKIA